MPPTHPLSTPCRYGYNCTRPGCFFTHPKGMNKEHGQHPKHQQPQQACTFGRSCFRKVCNFEHPDGRMMDQLRPGIDYCAACALVRPAELARVSAAFMSAFPASDDGNDRSDFVAAVPMSVAFQDWKRYRGVSTTGTPNGVLSSLEKVKLFPRTRKSERLLQDPANRSSLRWSPTPYRPWKTLERMATHDQFWEENQEMYLLCAGYESTPPATGMCIELSVTSVVKSEDGGDAVKAGMRVAGEVLGLPDVQSHKWFVFHLSHPEESDDETVFVTVKAILDTSKMPTSYHRPERRPPYAGAQSLSSLAAAKFPTRSPSAHSTAVPASTLAAAQFPTRSPSAHPSVVPVSRSPGMVSPIGTALPVSSYGALTDAFVMPRSLSVPTPTSVASASSLSLASTDLEYGSSALSFGSFIEREVLTKGVSSPTNSLRMRIGVRASSDQMRANPALGLISLPPRPTKSVIAAMAPVVDELSKLLTKLNMSKFRQRFDVIKVDYDTLKMMTKEEEFSVLGIPLGPRIKLMNELGIKRSSS